VPVEFEFFGYTLTIPSGHFLRNWFDPKSRFYEPYREAGLIKLCQALKSRTGTAIDIGANIGDTCAIIHRHTDLKIICIDASDFFYPYLTKNVERCFSDRATARQAFVLATPDEAPKGLYHWGGTAKAVDSIATEKCQSITVGGLLDTVGDISLFKVDIDGLDVDLIYGLFRAAAPNGPRFPIYFEYEFAGNGPAEIRSHANRFLTLLTLATHAGYHNAFMWDARGRFYGLLDLQHPRAMMNALNYLGHNKDQSV
jgi:FkbM family methyltransferase